MGGAGAGALLDAGAGGESRPGQAGARSEGGDATGGTDPIGEHVGGEQAGGSSNAGAPPSIADGGEGGSFSGPCPPSSLDGWASVAGLDFDPVLSSTAPLEVSVSTAEDLAAYAASAEPYVIRVSGTISLPLLEVTSNKKIVGVDSSATLEGGIRIAGSGVEPEQMVSNVVIQNLRINAFTSQTSDLADEADGIGVAYAHHVWIDHVDVWDAPGDDLDITNGSDYVTVSWTKFRFDQGVRRPATRVGHSDANAAEDAGRLKVTFHHNWWTSSTDQRMPRVRFGDVHVFDNYYSHSSANNLNSYCVAAALESRLRVENNFFDRVQNPHVFFSFVNNAVFAEPTAEMVVSGNTYAGVAQDAAGQQSGQGLAFVPPYAVTLEPADSLLRATIRQCAGSDDLRPESGAGGAGAGAAGGAAGAAP
jgi:pectate lyase